MQIKKVYIKNLRSAMESDKTIPSGWLYIGDEKERYVLGQPDERNILIFGVNPSTASPRENNLDSTIRQVRNLVTEYGCDGWIMVNLYPLRATNPQELPEEADKELLKKNLMVLEAIEKSYNIEKIWAAWGNIIDTRFYLGDALFDIQETLNSAQWFYRGSLTKQGNPRHPFYMKSGEEFMWFPVADYAANLRYADCY